MIRREFLKRSTIFAISPALANLDEDRQNQRSSFPEVPGLTAYVAEFIVTTNYEDIPSQVLHACKMSMLDALGVGLAGSATASASLIRRYLSEQDCGSSSATVIGSRMRTTSRFAALANGISIHADDFDDTIVASSNGLGIHPSVSVLPAILAVAEAKRFSGKDLLLAYNVGVEVEAKITEAVVVRSAENAFHPTGTCGSFGSAAACSKLLKLDETRTRVALGIAANEAAGLRENFGTMTKPFAAGHSAENGVVAADLASLGWSASEKILEASLGYFRTESDTFRPDLLLNRLGNPWTFNNPGVSIKPYPSGALTHPAMAELVRIMKQHKIDGNDVVGIWVRTSREVYATLIHHHPQTGLQAKFSMEFCLAILLLQGRAGLADFVDAVVQRNDVQQMIQRIHYSPYEGQSASERLKTTLLVKLKDKREFTGENAASKGSLHDPMTMDEVTEKFRNCAAYVNWPEAKIRAIIDNVQSLEQLSAVGRLTSMLGE